MNINWNLYKLKIVAGTFILLVLCAAFFIEPFSACAEASEESTGENDFSYMLYDLEKGQTVISNESQAPADATHLANMMTCLIALENYDLTDKINAAETLISQDGKFVITAETSYTVEALVSTALMGNADNAVRLLAENIIPKSSTATSFVAYMNERAIEFGMHNTFFVESETDKISLQKTTVYDTVLFLQNALQNIRFKNIYCLPIAVSWDGIIIENPNNLVITNTTSTLGGSRGGFNSFENEENTETVTYYMQTATDNMLNYREIILAVSGIDESNYIEVQSALLNEFETKWRKTLFHRAGDVVSIMALGSEELNLSVNKDIYFYVPSDITNSAEYIENTSYTYAENRSPDTITAPVYTGDTICTVRYRLKDGLTFDITLYAKNTVVSERSTVNYIISLMYRYPELFITIAALFIFEMILSIRKIYWHFTLK